MPITQGVCVSYKGDILNGVHSPGDDYKIALFLAASNLDENTDSYTGTTNEVANGNGYTTGGKSLTGFSVVEGSGKAWLNFDDPSWTSANFSADGALIYNDTLAGKNAVIVIKFSGTITVSGGTFSVDIPGSGEGTALLRID